MCMSVRERLAHTWHFQHLRQHAPELLAIPLLKRPFLEDEHRLSRENALRATLLKIHPTLYKLTRQMKEQIFGAHRKRLLHRDAEKANPIFHPYLKQLLFSGQAWWPEVIAYHHGQRMWARYERYQESIPIWTLASIELWARTFL